MQKIKNQEGVFTAPYITVAAIFFGISYIVKIYKIVVGLKGNTYNTLDEKLSAYHTFLLSFIIVFLIIDHLTQICGYYFFSSKIELLPFPGLASWKIIICGLCIAINKNNDLFNRDAERINEKYRLAKNKKSNY